MWFFRWKWAVIAQTRQQVNKNNSSGALRVVFVAAAFYSFDETILCLCFVFFCFKYVHFATPHFSQLQCPLWVWQKESLDCNSLLESNPRSAVYHFDTLTVPLGANSVHFFFFFCHWTIEPWWVDTIIPLLFSLVSQTLFLSRNVSTRKHLAQVICQNAKEING